jgi:hypothetical protein
MAGQDPALFPRVTMREVGLISEAATKRDARLAWQQAQYARFAYHQPNKMPPDPAVDKPNEGRVPPEVAREMQAIRLRVKLEADRRQHGR